jgi:hypothetical protein
MGFASGSPRKARASSGVQSTSTVIFIVHLSPAPAKGLSRPGL